MSQIEEQLRALLGKQAPGMLPTDRLTDLRTKLCIDACDGLSHSLLQDLSVESVLANSIELERKVERLLEIIDDLCSDDHWFDIYNDQRKEQAKKIVAQIRSELS